MTYLCQRAGFVQIAVLFIKKRLEETRVECSLRFYSGDERANVGTETIERDYDANIEPINNYRKKKILKKDEFDEKNELIKNQTTASNTEKLIDSTNILDLEEVKQ